MKRHPFLIFTVIVGTLIAGVIWYIQSPLFARSVKGFIYKKMPSDMGIEGDFKEFAIRLLPPVISIKEPKVTFKKDNILNIPQGSSVVAERVDFGFQLFQMISGNVRVHEISIINGDVHFFLNEDLLNKKQIKKKSKSGFHWEELLEIRADAVSIQKTHLHIESSTSNLKLEFNADSLRLEQSAGKIAQVYELGVDLSNFKGEFPKAWVLPSFLNTIERIQAQATINSQGIQIKNVNLNVTGVQAQLKGLIKGDILNPKELMIESAFEAKGKIEKFLEIIKEKSPDLGGEVSFVGKIRGNLNQFEKTAFAEGVLDGTGMHYKAWNADRLKLEGSWSAAEKGGELVVKNIGIFEKNVANSGRIEAGPFKIKFDPKLSSFSVPVHLDQAHIHWLGAGALADVYPLDFKMSGLLDVNFVQEKSWFIRSKLTEIKIDRFQLTNQKLNVTKALKRVLDIKQLTINHASLLINSNELAIEDINIHLPKTKLKAEGKVDFKTGYDLKVQSEIDLDDFGTLSENIIKGKGTLSAHVHGPSSRALIDFDADLKDAFYLNLNLGNLKGRITWDDDPQNVIFSKITLEKGRSIYQANGFLDVGKKDIVDLNFDIPRGDLRDFIKIFDFLVKDLWWFPAALNGPLTGAIHVGGGIGIEELKVTTQLSGTSWEFYGERFRAVQLKGGYDRGKYYLEEVKAAKKKSEMIGSISFDSKKIMKWSLHSPGLPFTEFDYLARLNIPVRGVFSVESEGQGKIGSIESSSKVNVSSFLVKGISKPDSELNIKTQQGILKLDGKALGGQGKIIADYNWNPNLLSFLNLKMDQLDFSVLFYLLNPNLIQDSSFSALSSGELRISFHSGKLEYGEGHFNITQAVLEKSNTFFRLAEPVSLSLNNGTVYSDPWILKGNIGESTLLISSKNSALDGKISGNINLSLLEFFFEQVEKSTGLALLDFIIAGNFNQPIFLGKVKLDNASIQVDAVDAPFEALSGNISIKQNVVSTQRTESDFAGGRFSLSGKAVLFADRFPELSLKAELQGNKLKVYPFQYIKLSGPLDIQGDGNPYSVKGNLIAQSGLTREKFTGPKTGESLRALKYTPKLIGEGARHSRFKLEIDVSAEKDILIQNGLFNAEARGKLKIVNTLVAPRVLGTAEIIQGKMLFKDRAFQIQSAKAVFDNPTVIDPKFNLTATTDVNDIKVQLYANGDQNHLKVDLSSTPVLPESEIISLLTFGFTQKDASRISTTDRTLIEQGGAANLLLNSLDFNREVESKTGINIQLDESVNTQLGTSIFKPQSPTEAAAPKIIIKKSIGKKLRLIGGSTVGIGSNSQKEVNAELQVTPGFSVMGVWENFQTTDTQDSRTSYGLDLKLEKRFK